MPVSAGTYKCKLEWFSHHFNITEVMIENFFARIFIVSFNVKFQISWPLGTKVWYSQILSTAWYLGKFIWITSQQQSYIMAVSLHGCQPVSLRLRKALSLVPFSYFRNESIFFYLYHHLLDYTFVVYSFQTSGVIHTSN